MSKKSLKQEIEELESNVKDLLSDISDTKVNSELFSLENAVESALSELSDLKEKFPEIITHPRDQLNQDGKYLMAARRFQNSMTVMILAGAKKRDFKTFEEGFNFYNNALTMTISIGNQTEIEQVKNEFAQALFKILKMSKEINDDEFKPFLIKTCKGLAEIYDSFNRFDIGLEFHIRAGNLLANNPVLNEIEYFQVFLDYILLNDRKNSVKIYNGLVINHIKTMAQQILKINGINNEQSIEKIKSKIEVLGAQRRFDTKNIIYLLETLKNMKIEKKKFISIEEIEVSSESVPLSDEKVNMIKTSLSQGIQQLHETYPNIQIPVTPQIDTSTIISELKEAIASEISKEIKSLSSEIVSKILSSLPSVPVVATSRPRSGGVISDDDIPEIELIEGGPQEKPQRPKLDDMIDSIIVSE